ncbi:putative amidohydrolase YtcJ [Aurantimicrobium minutum]|uniref:amidohydrolase n=1 Tax=Aurantimicrobium minutum TaxID=708131 RepID=UPI002473A692|nr:amidohydrolase [Aurantimicrobium minutum]MDH6532823.1 putative amidohydrolase YtcJ [Aurantimicrobium minutum]
MAADLIIKASSIITMDPAVPRAEAVAVDSAAGTIVAVGSLAEVQAANAGVSVQDLGDTVLMPGLIDPHSHPALSGMSTQSPAYWIAPYVGFPTYADVTAFFQKLDKEVPAGQPLMFNGLDRILHGAPELTNLDLDVFFPSRPVVVMDNSGHEAYFNSANITALGWIDNKPPADPVGASFGRNADGTSNGRAYEVAALFIAGAPVLANLAQHPLKPIAEWYKLMGVNGITSTSEHTYQGNQLKAYIAMAMAPDSPLRISLYHMSIEADCDQPIQSPIPESKLKKQGIKLWADGSPWVGTIAASFPYIDNDTTRNANITLGPGGEGMMNYNRAELDQILDKLTPSGYQMAFHCNGDVGMDIVLDAYEHALATHGLLGTDHRWRIEHMGACRGDQFERAARLGVSLSLSPFQFIYWGDVLDGEMFPSDIGSQWQRVGDAFRSGAVVTFHNDGSVSPPIPLLNWQATTTRQTASGKVHGANQAISLDDAIKAHTVNAAFQLGREHEIGSIQVGKLADFVELSLDPYLADLHKLTEQVKVQGTWVGGKKINLDAFLSQVEAMDPTEHKDLAQHVHSGKKCC